uniref:Uncharacterized protein n=1 Tax=Arundo donax TaxID=35708 RepID=A0A0A9DNK7_ARUDO
MPGMRSRRWSDSRQLCPEVCMAAAMAIQGGQPRRLWCTRRGPAHRLGRRTAARCGHGAVEQHDNSDQASTEVCPPPPYLGLGLGLGNFGEKLRICMI